jgi:hypothetical protein
MADWLDIGTSSQGVRWRMRDNDDGKTDFLATQDTTPHLDQNKAMFTENDGYSKSRDLRRVASIPAIVISEWLTKYGVDFYNPDHWPRVKQLLNSSDYLYLRTAPGRL